VLVTEVEAGSPADEKVSPGDMILQVSAEEVASPQDVQRISEAKSSSTGLVLFLLSNSKGEYRFVAVKAR
jgi:serine protease Do